MAKFVAHIQLVDPSSCHRTYGCSEIQISTGLKEIEILASSAGTEAEPAAASGSSASPTTTDEFCGISRMKVEVTLGEGADGGEGGGRLRLFRGELGRVELDLDLTPPTIVATVDPPANASGWHTVPAWSAFHGR
jgi:hypothetical protein